MYIYIYIYIIIYYITPILAIITLYKASFLGMTFLDQVTGHTPYSQPPATEPWPWPW